MFLKDKYGKKWKLQAAKVLRTGALCVALAGVGTGVMGTLGELGADLGRLGLITAYADEFAAGRSGRQLPDPGGKCRRLGCGKRGYQRF